MATNCLNTPFTVRMFSWKSLLPLRVRMKAEEVK